jgi:pimeloyl-ACP methyl ester carboxylesterase
MKRWLWRIAVGFLVALLVTALAALGYRACRQHLTAAQLVIRSPAGIAEGRFVELGGIRQWITIRGEDRANPVLLILAGGPGNSLVPLAPVFRGWERDFTVVQWDQRGAGKTYGANGRAEAPMTMDQMVSDGIELSRYLRDRLQPARLAVVGHSWGSMLGVLMVKAHPELYCAYVGTGQVVAKAEKETILYAGLLEQLRADSDRAAITELEAVGPPPYRSEADLLVERRLSERYDTAAERNLEATLRPVVLFAPAFSLADIWSLLQGQKYAGDALYEETLGYDARALGPDFGVPFVVIDGDHDRVTPADLALDYFAAVAAPRKVFVLLPGGGHSAILTMPERFLRSLDRYVRPLCADGGITENLR